MHGRYALYEALGLSPQSCVDEVKKSYKRLSQRHHPDRADSNGRDVELYRRITNAHHILNDPLKKEEYDRLGDAFDDEENIDDDDLGDLAIPSFMFSAAPFITPYHPFSIFVQSVPDPLKCFAEFTAHSNPSEEKRLTHSHLASISDVEATLEDRMAALKGLLELCAKGNSIFVTESVLDDEDALPTIIEDIQNDEEDETIKFLSTELLHVVSTANYVDVYQTGGLPAVLSVLKTENTKVLHSALLSLQHLTQLGSACAECFKCNVVQYCVHLMHKKSIDVLLTASHILHNLVVEHADPHAAIVECRRLATERYFGEIIRVVDEQQAKLEVPSKVAKSRRKEARAHNSLSLQSQKVLTAVLAVLAASEESEFVLINEEDARRLFAMLAYKGVRDVVTNACTVIQALLHHRRAILAAGDELTEMLVDLTLSLVKEEKALTASVVLLTTIVHCGLLRSEDVSRREVGKILVTHLKSKNEETSVAAARGLAYLCAPSIGESEFIACAYNANGQIQYLDIASTLDEEGVKKNGAPKLHKAIAPHLDSIVKQFLLVIQGTVEGTELRPASVMCAGLAALAQHEAGRKAMLRQPVLESLAQLLAKSGTGQVEKEAASLAVLNFSKVGKLINPAGNQAHKEALRLLASQLHSKNQRIQACIISTFLSLAHEKVPLDFIYGRTLEQLKTTRMNSKLATQLYEVLTAPDESDNFLDPSAASKKRDNKQRGKKGVNGAAELPASESESESSEGCGGGNNMFAALRGGAKKKKKPQKEEKPPQPEATKRQKGKSKAEKEKEKEREKEKEKEKEKERELAEKREEAKRKEKAGKGKAKETKAKDEPKEANGELRVERAEGGRGKARGPVQQAPPVQQPGEELRSRGERSEPRGEREGGRRERGGKKKTSIETGPPPTTIPMLAPGSKRDAYRDRERDRERERERERRANTEKRDPQKPSPETSPTAKSKDTPAPTATTPPTDRSAPKPAAKGKQPRKTPTPTAGTPTKQQTATTFNVSPAAMRNGLPNSQYAPVGVKGRVPNKSRMVQVKEPESKPEKREETKGGKGRDQTWAERINTNAPTATAATAQTAAPTATPAKGRGANAQNAPTAPTAQSTQPSPTKQRVPTATTPPTASPPTAVPPTSVPAEPASPTPAAAPVEKPPTAAPREKSPPARPEVSVPAVPVTAQVAPVTKPPTAAPAVVAPEKPAPVVQQPTPSAPVLPPPPPLRQVLPGWDSTPAKPADTSSPLDKLVKDLSQDAPPPHNEWGQKGEGERDGMANAGMSVFVKVR